MFYVYIHKRLDTGEVCYVGKGKGARAFSKQNRNRHWQFIVNKHGVLAHIIKKDLTESDALELESRLIKHYQTTTKSLVNVYPGGTISPDFKGKNNPFYGHHHAPETIEKLKNRRVSESTRLKMKASAKNKVFTESHRKNIGRAGIGRKSSLKGKRHPNQYRFSGKCFTPFGTFESTKHASEALRIPYQTVISRCRSTVNLAWHLEKEVRHESNS